MLKMSKIHVINKRINIKANKLTLISTKNAFIYKKNIRKCYKKYFILCFILMYESNFVLDKLYIMLEWVFAHFFE